MKRTFTKLAHFTTAAIIILLVLLPKVGMGQKQTVIAVKTSQPITIDGVVTDQEWASIPALFISQKVPNAGDPPTQKTELRIAYDQDYLYMSGRMFDDEPEKIVANSTKRDDFTENTEWCGLLIDSYNDRENALAFFVTPQGSKLDMALSNDIQGPSAFNLSWNGYWDIATTRNENGWFAEIRIPFTTLPFEIKDGKVIMGITAWRYLARNDETDIYPPRDLSTGSSFRPSLTQRFEFDDINQKKPIHITPYILGGRSSINSYNTESGTYESLSSTKKEVGLDAKIGLSTNATLDLSINTDFAQVEVDDQQVNLGRLNIFFPEKRLFFQERAGLFDFNFGNNDKLFHSRRIGINDGEQVRILGGIRAVGKFGKWEGGILTMQTDASKELSSENFTVLRLKKKVINDQSTIGLIYTNRGDFDVRNNSVYGLDATIKYLGQNFLSARWAQSFSSDLSNNGTLTNGTKYYIELATRSQKGLAYNINYGRTDDNYSPGIGFEHRSDFRKLNINLNYNLFPSQASKIVQHGPYVNGDFTWGNENNILESQYFGLGYNALTKLGYSFDVRAITEREELIKNLFLPNEIIISSGQYDFYTLTTTIASPSAQKVSYAASLSAGSFYNGSKTSIFIAPTISINQNFSIEGNYEYNRLSFNENDKPSVIQLTSLKALYTFNTKLSINAIAQYNNVTKKYLGSLRIRFNPREGNDFYLVYNGDLNDDRNRVTPVLPRSNSTTVLLKYSYTFHI